MIGRDLVLNERAAEKKQAQFNEKADAIAAYGIAMVYGTLAAFILLAF